MDEYDAMALTIDNLSEDVIVLNSPKLKEQIIDCITIIPSMTLFFAIPIALIFGIVGIPREYNSLKERSNKGYLEEMTCERLEKNFVNCKLENTDVKGKKTTIFSTPIKSANYSVLTTEVYTCSISLFRRDGTQIKNIKIFTNIESSSSCPSTRSTSQKINQYILGEGNKPLYWRKDDRVGDLTKDFNPVRAFLLGIRAFMENEVIYTSFLLLCILYAFSIFNIPFLEEEIWQINNRSKTISRKYKGLFSQGEHKFSFNVIEGMEHGQDSPSFSIKYRDLTQNKSFTKSLSFKDKIERTRVLKFLENATGLTSQQIDSD